MVKVENGSGGIQMSIRLWMGWAMLLLLTTMMILSVESARDFKIAPERLEMKGWVG